MQEIDWGAMTAGADQVYYRTRSICPTCEELVPGAVIARGDQIYVTRSCPQHGAFEGVICADRTWYEWLPKFDGEGIKPKNPHRPLTDGCPEDCGLCDRHKQIAGTAAIEISNECDAECPACLADNQKTFRLTSDDVGSALDNLLQSQDFLDTFTLSGGEPTLHPELFEMIRRVDRPQVGRVVVNSNGVRIASDEPFVDRLAQEKNVYVSLHYDGEKSRILRGVGHHTQERALARLCEKGVKSVPLVLAAQGVNDHYLGGLVADLITRSPLVRSTIISMMTYTGRGGSDYPGNPLERLTIAGALDAIEKTSGGRLHKRDFMPLPMPNPLCAAIGYFLVMDGEITPMIPLADLDQIIECTRNSNFGRANHEFEMLLRDTMDRLYTEQDENPEAGKILAKFRVLVDLLFPQDRTLKTVERQQIAEQYIKTVYLMQFMDAWSFDASRLPKCSCQHLLPGNEIIPSCGYYSYHRRFDPRFVEPEPTPPPLLQLRKKTPLWASKPSPEGAAS